ncbi:MAG: hypothetical protein WD063_03970 [Pirellulales bacterium]
MLDLLSKSDAELILPLAGMLVGVIAILGGITVAITKVVSSHYRRTQLDDMEATLKLEMIQRGMSAAEIKEVLEARMAGDRPSLADLSFKVAQFATSRPFGKACEKA